MTKINFTKEETEKFLMSLGKERLVEIIIDLQKRLELLETHSYERKFPEQNTSDDNLHTQPNPYTYPYPWWNGIYPPQTKFPCEVGISWTSDSTNKTTASNDDIYLIPCEKTTL